MRKGLLLTLLLAMISSVAFSQADQYWSPNSENKNAIPTDKAVARVSYPKEFKLFNLNAAPFRQKLFSVLDKQTRPSTIISLPNAVGNLEQFEIFEASNFEPALQAQFPEIKSGIGAADLTGSSNGTLKTMRLAQSCNGEYSNYFGATSSAQVDLVLAAFNATITRCNGVFEKDLAVHLNLIANTTAVIYYNPSTDPYTTLSSWNLQLQQTLTSVIGNANYDIGHMFGASGGGGNAGCIGCVCVNPANNRALGKGSGITSPADGIPSGDNFDIDYVVHEMGHQLGANHTFSMSNEGTGQQKEVGSGITIMGYAGITSQDVAPHSIDIFHETSIAQIQANLATKTCPVSTNISANNAAPVIAAVNNYAIPISTPFALTGSATDANGDALTYCWEQNDNSSTTGSGSVASITKTSGPNWLSFSPTASGTRLFPKLSTILGGLNVTPPLA